MGLLTNPASSKHKSKYAKLLIKGNPFLCIILYIAGLSWFVMLGNKEFSNSTYFSENALLPGKNHTKEKYLTIILTIYSLTSTGLVYSDIKSETINYALNLYNELERERDVHKSQTPYAWLQAKMRQIGLDTYTHNFTLNYPLGGGKVFTGKNVYGILRAPRIGSTESFVITAPYRPPNSVHPEVTHSIPLLLAFASHARSKFIIAA